MVIGFDFDKVFKDYPPLIPYGFIDFLYKGAVFPRKTKESTLKLHYRFPGTIEQKIRILSHFPIFRHPLKTNISELKKISEENKNKTYLVSSRFSFLRQRTETILTRYKLNKYFHGIYFNYENKQPHIFKEETIRKLKIDIYVDDDLDLSLFLAKKLPKLIIYWVRDGRGVEVNLPKNIVAIKDLRDLQKHLSKK